MPHARRLPTLLAASALLAACHDFIGPGIEGRWAAPGIQLIGQASDAELQFYCTTPAHVGHGLLPDAAGVFRFSTQVVGYQLATPIRVNFVGQLVRDTLIATVTRAGDGNAPDVLTYVMLRNGDSGIDKVACLL